MAVADLALAVPADLTECANVREAVRRWWVGDASTDEQLNDALLVATELFSNAANAAKHSGSTSLIHLRAEHRATGIVIEVQNEGPGFNPDTLGAAKPDQRNGRGIAIAKALGQLTVAQRGALTLVRVEISA